MIYDKLFDWQKAVVDKVKDHTRFGLWLDCGLGKTPLSLALAEANGCDKVLVVTISSKAIESKDTAGSWWDWGSKSRVPYRIINRKNLKDVAKSDMMIVNYEYLFKRETGSTPRLRDEIVTFIRNCRDSKVCLIIDESHKVKNLQTLQTKAILDMIRNLMSVSTRLYTYLLTGTPFTTGFIDLYAQLKILGCPMNKGEFVDNFCIKGNMPGLLGWQQPIVGYKNVDKLYELVHKYAITIKSAEVVNLPEQIFIEHGTKMSDPFRVVISERLPTAEVRKIAASRKIEGIEYPRTLTMPNPFYRNLDYPDLKYFADTPGTFWLRARECSIGFQGNADESVWYDRTRLNELKRFLEQNEDNYIIFYNYTPEMIEIYSICDQLGYNVDVYCGEIKSTIFYDEYVNQSEGERLVNHKNILLANFASGSTGMNWQMYNKCIIFSLPLYKDWEQGLKRLHRIGQKNTVIYHLFYQNNWLDKGMRKALEENVQYTEDMFKDGLRKAVEENAT